MKKATLLLFILILGTGGFFGTTKAQTKTFSQETIESYNSNIVVNVDNSIDVTEAITYNTGPEEHHGIYRDIYPYSSQNRKMRIENVSVTDKNDIPYQFQVYGVNGNTRIKIGDPNETFIGQKIYIIKYRATRAVAQLKNIDEIYWNATGNEWGMPIEQSQVSVSLPAGAVPTQSACYYGPKGSTKQCEAAIINTNGAYVFDAPEVLNPQDGLTVAFGFPKGIVVPYSSADNVSNFFDSYWSWLVILILPILTFIFSLLYWFRKGRDTRRTGLIIPQYDVPDNLNPMEVGSFYKRGGVYFHLFFIIFFKKLLSAHRKESNLNDCYVSAYLADSCKLACFKISSKVF